MRYVAAVLIGVHACLPGAAAIAATPEGGSRASMLSIVLVAGAMIVLVKLAIAYARRRLEEEHDAAREKLDAGVPDEDSPPSNG